MNNDPDDLPLPLLLPAIAKAEDLLARLDERVRRSPVGQGFVERGHFFDAAAALWVAGELVTVEDLVLHDAYADIRTPTHELTRAHGILRARRRIAAARAGWALSEEGIADLRGRHGDDETPAKRVPPPAVSPVEAEDHAGADALDAELAELDAVLERSRQVLGQLRRPTERHYPDDGSGAAELVYDPDWNESEKLGQWRATLRDADHLPPTLAAAVVWDAWEEVEPLQRQHALGTQLIGAYLRQRDKVTSHLFCLNVGLKSIPRERRRSRSRIVRLLAALDAMSEAALSGLKELDRLAMARSQMERRLKGRRSSSSLPAVIDLVLSRPTVSAAMIAKEAKVTQRGALNLVKELGVREMTGRGRYRAWGVI